MAPCPRRIEIKYTEPPIDRKRLHILFMMMTSNCDLLSSKSRVPVVYVELRALYPRVGRPPGASLSKALYSTSHTDYLGQLNALKLYWFLHGLGTLNGKIIILFSFIFMLILKTNFRRILITPFDGIVHISSSPWYKSCYFNRGGTFPIMVDVYRMIERQSNIFI